MIRETVRPLQEEVQRIRDALQISQNEVARRAGLHESILSRLLNGTLTAEPSRKKLRRWLDRQQQRLQAAV